MSKHTHVWTWPIAGYLFLGGLGSGMMIVATIADLFFGLGFYFIPCALGSAAALGLGSFLLIFELGRPFQFWRVFSKEMAVLTFGAWMVVALMVFAVLYLSFWFAFIPWHTLEIPRLVVAVICLVVGCGVILYTGIELSSMKARAFWNTPALPILFALSGILAGTAANLLLISFWPFTWEGASSALATSTSISTVQAVVVMCIIGLTAFTLVVTLLYVLMMYFSSSPVAKKAAARWLTGSYSLAFWGGLVVLGLLVPLILLSFGSLSLALVGSVLIILGGVCLRFLVVYCDDRRELGGEALYHRRLPQGDELFMKKDW